MVISWATTACDNRDDCGYCKNVTYENGVKINESVETEYCGDNFWAQKEKPDLTMGSLVTKTECR